VSVCVCVIVVVVCVCGSHSTNFWTALKMALQWLTNNKATTAANSMADGHYSYPITTKPPFHPLSFYLSLYLCLCLSYSLVHFYNQFCLHFIFAKFLSLVIHVRSPESSKLCAWLICVQCEVKPSLFSLFSPLLHFSLPRSTLLFILIV